MKAPSSLLWLFGKKLIRFTAVASFGIKLPLELTVPVARLYWRVKSTVVGSWLQSKLLHTPPALKATNIPFQSAGSLGTEKSPARTVVAANARNVATKAAPAVKMSRFKGLVCINGSPLAWDLPEDATLAKQNFKKS